MKQHSWIKRMLRKWLGVEFLFEYGDAISKRVDAIESK